MEISTGFIARSERSFVACIHVSLKMVQSSAGFRATAWKTIGDAVFALSQRPQFVDEGNVHEALSAVLSLVTNPSDRIAGLLLTAALDETRPLTGITALEVAIIAFDHRLSLGSAHSAGMALFDLGVALQAWSAKHPPSETTLKARKQALQCIKDAMHQDPRNDVVWTMLGNFYFAGQPKVAQHAYIKALELDSKVCFSFTLEVETIQIGHRTL
jgi:superkiller protein 3